MAEHTAPIQPPPYRYIQPSTRCMHCDYTERPYKNGPLLFGARLYMCAGCPAGSDKLNAICRKCEQGKDLRDLYCLWCRADRAERAAASASTI